MLVFFYCETVIFLVQITSAFWVVQVVFFEQLRVFLALEPTEVPGDLGLQALESFLDWRNYYITQ